MLSSTSLSNLEIDMFLGRLFMRPAILPTVALLAFAAGVAFTALAAGQVAAGPSTPTAKVHKRHVVLMQMNTQTSQFRYEPETVVAKVGDVIEWKNKDVYQHTVTSISDATLRSGIINMGKSWRFKAVKKGTFKYYCKLHPNMRGTLIVR
jgi:plastocyanin